MSRGLVPLREMDDGLQLAVNAAGGVRRLAKRLGLRTPGIPWRSVPQDRVFEVSAALMLPPATLRPDLKDWIDQELARRTLATAEGGANLGQLGGAIGQQQDPRLGVDADVVDFWAAIASALFVARLRGMKIDQVYSGEKRHEQAARAYAMALAKVVGRGRSYTIAAVFDCSRQNVDNATERYLRAREGDDPDDYLTGQFPDGAPRVLERGSNRLRHAKEACPELWDAEDQFAAFVAGDWSQLPKAERRRST